MKSTGGEGVLTKWNGRLWLHIWTKEVTDRSMCCQKIPAEWISESFTVFHNKSNGLFKSLSDP